MEKTNNALSFRETGLHIKILDYVHDDNDDYDNDDDNDDDNDLNLFAFTKFITVCVNAKTAHSSRCFFFSKSVFRN